MKRFARLLIVSSIACLVACAQIPVSQPEPSDGEKSGPDDTLPTATVTVAPQVTNDWERTPGGNPKLESSLNQLLNAYQEEGLSGAQAFAEAHQIVLKDGRVEVVVVTTTTEALPDVRDAIEALGGKYESHFRNQIQALVPLDDLETLAERLDVELIREPERANP